MKITNCAKDWIKACEINCLERATLHTYHGHVRNHIVPGLGDANIITLKTPDIERFRQDMLATHSFAQTKKVLVSLKAIFKHAQLMGIIVANVTLPVTMKGAKRHKKRTDIPTKAEIKSLIENAPPAYKAFVITAIFTGMRSSELRGLQWRNINFDLGIITIDSKIDRYGERGSPKSGAAYRNIPMTPRVKQSLKDWQVNCPTGVENLVFPNSVGKPQSHSNICNRMLYPLLIKCGIVNEHGKHRFGTHGLRHAAASLFIDQGWSPKKIQTILGHANITMTFDTYGHLFEDTADDVAKMAKLEEDLFAA
ncbi:MAG: site-specific integrase [Kordiimonadaceae bacterium]|nr:site-specific integrase [Kordiimonadaceae bacterium]